MGKALEAVAARHPGDIPVLGRNHPPVRAASTPVGLHGNGLHQNACVEMCVLLEGSCRLWTVDGYLPLRQGDVMMIPPGTIHAEGWQRKSLGYSMIWTTFLGDLERAVLAIHCQGRWGVEESAARHSHGAENVVQAMAELLGDKGGMMAKYLLHGGLLTALVDMLRAAETDAGPERGHGEMLAEVRNYLDRHFAEPVTVASLAALFRTSPNYLNRLFSRREGMGIHAYLLRRRLAAASDLLRQGQLAVKEIADRVGFADPLYFSRLYRRRFGHPPSGRHVP
jgi:AraC-like DNA-binding protein